MLDDLENNPILDQAIDKWGWEKQLDICEEECAELIVAIKHSKRGRCGARAVSEEIADVLITALQARKIISPILVDEIVQEKLARLKSRIER